MLSPNLSVCIDRLVLAEKGFKFSLLPFSPLFSNVELKGFGILYHAIARERKIIWGEEHCTFSNEDVSNLDEKMLDFTEAVNGIYKHQWETKF